MNKKRYLHVKMGDNVIILTGDDKKKTGKIIDVDVKNNRVKVENMRVMTHFGKKKDGGMTQKEGWIHASNVRRLNNEG